MLLKAIEKERNLKSLIIEWTNRWTDRQTDVQTDGHTEGKIDGRSDIVTS